MVQVSPSATYSNWSFYYLSFCIGGSRGGTRGARPPSLFLDQTEGRKTFCWRPLPPFSKGLDDRQRHYSPPPPFSPYFKFWIQHCSVVLFQATCWRGTTATTLPSLMVDNLCNKSWGNLEMTISRHNRVSTKNGWKSVLLGTLTKSTKTGFG